MKLRVVRDIYAGYEVQAWRWWFPFWMQCGTSNTHSSLEKAIEYAKNLSQPVVKVLQEEDLA